MDNQEKLSTPETKKHKTKTQHIMCWTSLRKQTQKNVNKNEPSYKQLWVKTRWGVRLSADVLDYFLNDLMRFNEQRVTYTQ